LVTLLPHVAPSSLIKNVHLSGLAPCLAITPALLFSPGMVPVAESTGPITVRPSRPSGSWEDSMRNRFTRREFGGLLASGAAAAAVTTSGGLAKAQSRPRFIWWGNPDRDKRTIAAIDLYGKKHPDITIAPESYAWADYWPKLATQAAGQNLADIIQMDYRYIFEWARRGQLADLTQFLGKT